MKNNPTILRRFLATGALLTAAIPSFAVDAITDVSKDSVLQKMGNIFGYIGLIVGVGAAAYCSIQAIFAISSGREGGFSWIVRAFASLGIGLSVWALAMKGASLLG